MIHTCRVCGKLFEDKKHNTAVCTSCHTSDVIVDCFAGCGARADATKELHRTYIGIDFNPELVD